MPRPGVDVVITEPAPTGGAVLDTSQGFFIGSTERGPLGYVIVRSLKEYERHFGVRSGGIVAHDSARAFFTEKGSKLHMARLIGSAAVPAEATVGVTDASAISPGAWGDDVTVGFEDAASSSTFAAKARKPNRRAKAAESSDSSEAQAATSVRCVVTYGDVVERSTPITTAGEAVAWSQNSNYVRLSASDLSAALTVVAAVSLTGGTDDPTIDEDTVGRALDQFGYNLGPGQVSYCGCTDINLLAKVLDHCIANKRCALLDLEASDALTLAADVQSLYGYEGAKFAQALAPPLMYQGPVSGTQIPVPYSAIQAGIIARADRASGNPNEAAAGVLGQSIGASSLTVEYTDDERETLNEAGVSLAKIIQGTVRTYGSRTCAGPDETNWMWFANSRVVMAVAHDCDATAENYVHKQIDAQRKLFTSLEQDLGGVCLHYVTLDALWEFTIDTGPAVNTPDTIAAGEIHAVVGLKTAPSAEWVRIEISKTPLS